VRLLCVSSFLFAWVGLPPVLAWWSFCYVVLNFRTELGCSGTHRTWDMHALYLVAWRCHVTVGVAVHHGLWARSFCLVYTSYMCYGFCL
jgi:hypothetical protein